MVQARGLGETSSWVCGACQSLEPGAVALGVRKVTRRLLRKSEIGVDFVHVLRLPIIQEEIEQQLRNVDVALSKLPAANYIDPRLEVTSMLRNFVLQLSKVIDGSSVPEPAQSLGTSGHFFADLHSAFGQFRDDVHRTAPQLRPWSSRAPVSKESKAEMLECAQIFDALPLPAVAQRKAVKEYHVNQIMELAKTYVNNLIRPHVH